MNSLNLSVSSHEAQELLEYYKHRKNELVEANRAVFNKLLELDGMIAKLSAAVPKSDEQFPVSGSWNQKIQYVLRDVPAGIGCSLNTIVNRIASEEGVEKDSDRWKEIYKGVAPSLSNGDKLYKKSTSKEGKTIYSLL